MSSQKCELLYKLVKDSLSHDSVMARCVLGRERYILEDYEEFENCFEKSFVLIKWMGNFMTLTGAFLYAKFNQWRTGTGAHPTDKERPNALYLKRLLAGIQSTNAYFDQASSGLRVLRVLDGLYGNFDMNFLVIKYLIINSQIEAGFNFQSKSGLSKLIGFPYEKSFRVTCSPNEFEKYGQNLAAAFNYVSLCRSDPNIEKNWDLNKYKIDEVWSAFEDIFKTMEFMKRVKLDINDSEGNVNFKETMANGEEIYIPSHGVVRVFKTQKGEYKGVYTGADLPRGFDLDFCLLERIEYFSDNTTINAAIRLLYRSFDESNSVSVYFSEKEGLVLEDCDFPITREKSAVDYFKKISGYLPSMRSTNSFFRGMITTHFRYFNILAPSIVDAIDKDLDAKIRILKKNVKKEEALFKETLEPALKTLELALVKTFPDDWEGKIDTLCYYISNDDYYIGTVINDEYNFRTVIDWDTLMARILIYEGPSEVFKTVLLYDKNNYEIKDKDNIENTCKKIIAGLEMRYIDNVFEASDVASKQKEKELRNRITQNLNLDIYPPNYMLKMKCKVLAQSYIDIIISELTRIDKYKETEKNKFAENSIQDALEILKTCKDEKESSKAYKAFFKIIKAFLSFYAGIWESCHSRMNYEFEKSLSIMSPNEIAAKKSEIENKFFEGVVKKASELSELFHKESNDTNMAKCVLKELLNFANKTLSDEARYYNAVLARTPINSVKLAKVFYEDNEKIIFIYRGEKFNFEKAKECGIIIECLENVVRFLAGEEVSNISREENHEKNNYIGYKEHVERVVYPQVVTFAKSRENSDANKSLIMDHSGAFADWHKGGVQILTEFEYTNYSYYVLPNLNRIETEWWVEPVLVSCHDFDEKMRKTSNSVGDIK